MDSNDTNLNSKEDVYQADTTPSALWAQDMMKFVACRDTIFYHSFDGQDINMLINNTQRARDAMITSSLRRRRVDVVMTLSLRLYCVMCPLGIILQWLLGFGPKDSLKDKHALVLEVIGYDNCDLYTPVQK